MEQFLQVVSNVSVSRDRVIQDLLAVAETTLSVASGNGSVVESESVVHLLTLIGDVASHGVPEDEVRTFETPGGNVLQVVVPSSHRVSSGFALGPVTMPPLDVVQFRNVSMQVMSWARNLFDLESVSERMLTINVRRNGESVDLVNLAQPLQFRLDVHENVAPFGKDAPRRSCVFWNTTSASWSALGLQLVRANLTQVACDSTHATSFAVRFLDTACFFCTGGVPAGFFHVDLDVPASCWTVLSVMFLFCLPFAWLHKLDCRSWAQPAENVEAYLKPAPPVRRARSTIWQRLPWNRKPPPQAPARRCMKMTSFDEVPMSAKLLISSRAGAVKLHVAYPLSFRYGRPVVINPGGRTEEVHDIASFTVGVIVVKEPLAHTHDTGERVTQQATVQQQDPKKVAQGTADCQETVHAREDLEQDLQHDFGALQSASVAGSDLAGESACSSGEIVDVDLWVQQYHDLEAATRAAEGDATTASDKKATTGAEDERPPATLNLCGLQVHLQPHWMSGSVHMRRTEMYSQWFSAHFASGFVQGALFVMGDACHHEPAPAQCQTGGGFVTVGNIASAFWGTALASCLVFLLARLFYRPFMYGPVTALEQERFLKRWIWQQRCGWSIVVFLNSIFAAFILRLFQFFPRGLLERWISGLCTSSLSGMTHSATVRAIQFIRFFFLQLAQRHH